MVGVCGTGFWGIGIGAVISGFGPIGLGGNGFTGSGSELITLGSTLTTTGACVGSTLITTGSCLGSCFMTTGSTLITTGACVGSTLTTTGIGLGSGLDIKGGSNPVTFRSATLGSPVKDLDSPVDADDLDSARRGFVIVFFSTVFFQQQSIYL